MDSKNSFKDKLTSRMHLPLTLSIVYCLLDHIALGFTIKANSFGALNDSMNQVFTKLPPSSLSQWSQRLIGAYNDYVKFMVTMALLHIGIFLLRRSSQKLFNTSKRFKYIIAIQNLLANSKKASNIVKVNLTIRELFEHLVILVIQYSLIFCVLYIFVFGIVLLNQHFDLTYLSKKPVFNEDHEATPLPLQHQDLTSRKSFSKFLKYNDLTSKSRKNPNRRTLFAVTPPDVVQLKSSYTYDSTPNEESDFYASLDGQRVQLCEDGTLYSINISNSHKPISIESSAWCNNQIFSSDGLKTISDDSNEFQIINVTNSKILMKVKPRGTYIEDCDSIVFSPDGERIYYISLNRTAKTTTLYRFGITSPEMIELYVINSDGKIPCGIRISSNEKIMFISLSSDKEGVLYVIEFDNDNSAKMIGSYTSVKTDTFRLSTDETKIFLITNYATNLEIIDVAGVSPHLIINITDWNTYGNSNIFSMSVSKDDNTLVIVSDYMVFVLDVSDMTNIIHYRSLTVSGKIAFILPDNETLLVWKGPGTQKTLEIGKIITTYELNQPKDEFNRANLFISSIPTSYGSNKAVTLSPDEKTALVTTDGGLEIFDVVDKNHIRLKNRLYSTEAAQYILYSNDGRTLFLATEFSVKIINASSEQEISRIGQGTARMITSSNNNVLILQNEYREEDNFIYVNITDLNNPRIFDAKKVSAQCSDLNLADGYAILIEDWDQVTVNTFSDEMYRQSCILLGNDYMRWISVAVQESSNTLYAVGYLAQGFGISFLIYDASDTTNAIASLDLHLIYVIYETYTIISVTADSSLAYVSLGSNLYVLNITNQSSPYILNFIQDRDTFGGIRTLAASSNSSLGFALVTNTEELGIVDLSTINTLYTPTKSFYVGDNYEMKFVPGNTSNSGQLRRGNTEFKVVKLAIYNFTSNLYSITKSFLPPPSWITFDRENSVVTIQPDSPISVGYWQIFVAASTKIDESDFDIADSLKLLTTLQYLDIDSYLTTNFDPGQTLRFLPSKYNESQIRKVMTNHYYEAVITIEVKSSLNFTLEPYFKIYTASQATMKFGMVLYADIANQDPDNPPCRFVRNLDYLVKPDFDNTNTTMYIEDVSYEINQLLKLLTVDQTGVTSCNVIININDQMNPPLNTTIPNIQKHLRNNSAPVENLNMLITIQEEINNIVFYTSSYFTFTFDQNIFKDQNLQYAIENQDEIPWLVLHWPSISGTPPNQFWPSNEVVIKVRVFNEYKSTPFQVTLTVRWGLGDLLGKAFKIGGVLGSYIYIYLILNILCKKWYTYPKDFYIKVGETISPAQVLPIACIMKESRESKFILKYLGKSLAKLQSETNLAIYFSDLDQQINVPRLLETIDSMIADLPTALRSKVKYYTHRNGIRKDLINQLIINEITLRQLDEPTAKNTKRLFEKLKNYWFIMVRYVEWEPKWKLSLDQQSLQGELNKMQAKLNKELKQCQTNNFNKEIELITPQYTNEKKESVTSTEHKMSAAKSGNKNFSKLTTSFIANEENIETDQPQAPKSSQINMNLLSNSLLAHAYNQHHLKKVISELTITAKRKRKNIWWCPIFIARILNLDLTSIQSPSVGNLGYGIKSNIKNDVIYFSGNVDECFEGRNMIVQISQRGRLIRELSIYGIAA